MKSAAPGASPRRVVKISPEALVYKGDETPAYTVAGQLLPPARALADSSEFVARLCSRISPSPAPSHVPDALGPCMLWQGRRDGDGYGQTRLRSPESGVWLTVRAYRVTFAIHNRAWNPAGTILLHACDNPSCCAPLHLRAGTYSENLQEAYDKGRRKRPAGTLKWKGGPTVKMLSGGSPVSPNLADEIAATLASSDDPEGDALLLALDAGVSARTVREIGKGRSLAVARLAASTGGR